MDLSRSRRRRSRSLPMRAGRDVARRTAGSTRRRRCSDSSDGDLRCARDHVRLDSTEFDDSVLATGEDLIGGYAGFQSHADSRSNRYSAMERDDIASLTAIAVASTRRKTSALSRSTIPMIHSPRTKLLTQASNRGDTSVTYGNARGPSRRRGSRPRTARLDHRYLSGEDLRSIDGAVEIRTALLCDALHHARGGPKERVEGFESGGLSVMPSVIAHAAAPELHSAGATERHYPRAATRRSSCDDRQPQCDLAAGARTSIYASTTRFSIARGASSARSSATPTCSAADLRHQLRLAACAASSADLRAFAARRRPARDGRGRRFFYFGDYHSRLLAALGACAGTVLRVFRRYRVDSRAGSRQPSRC